MSEDTYAALETAVRNHVNDAQGTASLVTDWFVIAASLSEDEHYTGYTHARSDSSWHSMQGLLARGQRELDAEDEDE